MKTLVLALIAASSSCPASAAVEEVALYVKPGSLRGHVAIANRQTMIPEVLFVDATEVVRERRRYAFKFGRDESVLKDAAIQLEIVNDPDNPAPMTVSPEIGQGVLNVAALTNDLGSAAAVRKFLPDLGQHGRLRPGSARALQTAKRALAEEGLDRQALPGLDQQIQIS